MIFYAIFKGIVFFYFLFDCESLTSDLIRGKFECQKNEIPIKIGGGCNIVAIYLCDYGFLGAAVAPPKQNLKWRH